MRNKGKFLGNGDVRVLNKAAVVVFERRKSWLVTLGSFLEGVEDLRRC